MKVGRDLISRVTDAVLDDVREWQQRPLDDVYPVIFLDALVLKIRQGGTVQRRACYLALGVTVEGERDVLGIWLLGGRGRQVLDAGSERTQAARRPGHPDLLFGRPPVFRSAPPVHRDSWMHEFTAGRFSRRRSCRSA